MVIETPPVVTALLQYKTLQRKRFHVPGHAGLPLGSQSPSVDGVLTSLNQQLGFSTALLDVDLTELEGLDVLSTPEGCIAESQALTASLFGVAHTFYLVNGASGGLHACLLAGFQPNDAVLLPRNVHRAVLAGLILAGLTPVWCEPTWYPEWGLWGGVSPSVVEQSFQQNPHIRGVVITHPTYEGIATDLVAIATICKTYNKRFIVDEAHGVLLPWHQALPLSACQLPEAIAADAVVQSPHKTGGSLTQSAWLHLPHGSTLSVARVQQALNHLQTTSPSYLLLASLELAATWMGSVGFAQQLQRHLVRIQRLEQQLNAMPHIALLRPHHVPMLGKEAGTEPLVGVDSTRLYVRHATMAGNVVAEQLESMAGLAYESCNPYGVLYVAQLQQPAEDLKALENALALLPTKSDRSSDAFPCVPLPTFVMPTVVYSPRDAFFCAETRNVSIEAAVGLVSAETIVRCPPGIPILLPGEQVQAAHLPLLQAVGIAQIMVVRNTLA